MSCLKPIFLARCALFSALLCVCAWIAIPVGDSSFTLQTFGVFLALLTLGGKGGTVSIFVYLLLGAAGLPVFSGFRGGIGALLGVTGGYLWGFLLGGLIYWGITAFFGKKAVFIAVIVAMIACYACGTLWYFFAYTGASALSLWAILLKCVAPYILPDTVKIALAIWLSRRIAKYGSTQKTRYS